MTPQLIGILHPGEMGVSIATSARNGGNKVYWASGHVQDPRTTGHRRVCRTAGTLAALCRECQVIVSVCPPHAAEEVARRCWRKASPASTWTPTRSRPARGADGEMAAAGASFVDGGIVGGPAWQPVAPGSICPARARPWPRRVLRSRPA